LLAGSADSAARPPPPRPDLIELIIGEPAARPSPLHGSNHITEISLKGGPSRAKIWIPLRRGLNSSQEPQIIFKPQQENLFWHLHLVLTGADHSAG